MSVSEKIADYVIGLDYDKLPKDVQDILVTAVYNYMGCLRAGAQEQVSKVVRRTIEASFSKGKCHLIGTGVMSDPMAAALFNGTTANALGFDDMYAGGVYHPGTAAITAALVVSELVHPTGKQFMEAVLAGYEIGDRIARMVNPSQYKKWHTACAVGVFGACVSAGKLLGLDRDQMVSALGAAGTQACGLQECSDNMAIRLHHGISSRNGIIAALLAKNGFDGPKHILEGTGGYVNATSEFSGDIESQFDDLGEKYLIQSTTFKFYPCCGHIHACIDAAVFAMKNSGFKSEDIKSVKVGSYRVAVEGDSNPNPNGTQQAKFSIEYCVACGILYGNASMSEFSEWPPKKEITDMMAKTTVYVDDICEANYPRGKRGGTVTLVTDAGEYTQARYSRRGDPDCPLSVDDIRSKFMSLALMTMSRDKAEELDSCLARLPELEDASVLAVI